ncbi:smad nuclear-interacting protein 1-like [Homalodisca vitripennis]|uniref:smad nuclear-interacting protein 1-like n=1 Tax=Homalodisca vitripennis TaxID=197043 RepID=UPI001EECE9D5|nr:smad nuclear-interacting protein 1-like [Homalodisca vitripennis]
MKDNTTGRKHKRARSLSNSSHFTISDDDNPKQSKEGKNLEERYKHRKHYKHGHKHHRQQNSDSSENEEVNPKYKISEKRHKDNDLVPEVRVKEEPQSEDERDRKYKNRHSEQSRINDDSSRGNGSRHHREDSRRRANNSEPRGNDRSKRRPVREEVLSNDVEPEWGKKEVKNEKKEPAKNNAKPDFGLSGKLTEDANTFNGVVIKYSEPPEARRPKRRWRLYPFKGETSLPILHIHRQSAYLMGRDRKVADIPIDHPSCSKQHAALQYRLVPFTRADGSSGRQIKLYVIDLESANGTFLNNNKIDPKKYYELKERDVIKFGFSSRDYVLLHEHSKDSENDDDVNDE